MLPCSSLLVLLVLLTFAHAQPEQPTLEFGQLTTCKCPNRGTPTIQYTLTVPQWPATLAQAFVITLRNPENLTAEYPFTASVGLEVWNVSADSQLSSLGEIWVPLQNPGTVVNVAVTCSSFVTYTIEPVIPAEISGTTNISNFNLTSITEDSTPHAHWWAIPVNQQNYVLHSMTGFLWAELCQMPVTKYATIGFYMRVVFPGINATEEAFTLQGTDTYALSGSSNFRQESYVGVKISWASRTLTTPFFYVSVYAIDGITPVPITFNVYLTNLYAHPVYYGSVAGLYPGFGIQIEKDLFIGGTEPYYPIETEFMKLYYFDDQKDVNTRFFASACYLKSHAKSALFSGELQNRSHDPDLDNCVLKAPNLFKKHKGANTFALTYGDYVVLPNIEHVRKFRGYSSTKLMLGISISLSIFLGASLIAVFILARKLKANGYTKLNLKMQNINS